MASMKDFLLQYYLQMRFNDMPPEKRQTFMKYIEGGDDFRGNMKMWKRRLMHETQQNSNEWVQNDLPSPAPGSTWELSDDQWRDLYKEFREIMRSLDARANKFNDQNSPEYNKAAYDFVKEYFGPNKLFSHVNATPEAEQELDKLANTLSSNPGLEYTLTRWGMLGGDFTFKALKDGLRKKEYNKDSAFRDNLLRVTGMLADAANPNSYNYEPAFANLSIDFEKINKDGFDDNNIDQAKLDLFKGRLNQQTNTWTGGEYDILLRKIYNNEKIRKEISFSKIAQAFDSAVQQMDYDNSSSKDYLPDTPHDRLTPLQRFTKYCGDQYADILKKYEWLRGDELFLSPQAKNIVEALHKEHVKPTDGLDGIVNAASAIQKEMRYKSASSVEHSEWLMKVLGEIKQVMPKAYEGALSNGTQLHEVIEELIVRALREDPPKVEEAETAMEVISVCKYGINTSKIMDALRKEKVTLLSDGGLSWNQHEGIKQIMQGADWVLEKALKGIGEVITIAGNAINKSGSKFNGHAGQRLATARNRALGQNAADRQQAWTNHRQMYQAEINDLQAALHDQQNVNNNLQAGQTAINANNIDQYKQQHKQREDQLAQRMEQLNNAKQAQSYQNAQAYVNNYKSVLQQLLDLPAKIQQLDNLLQQIQQDLAGLNAPNNPMSDAEKTARATLLVQQEQQLKQEKQNRENELVNVQQQWQQITRNPNHWADYQRHESTLNNMAQLEQALTQDQAALGVESDRIAKWENAAAVIDEINKARDKRREEIRNWDQNHEDLYKRLMARWDLLETGRNSRTGMLYTRFGSTNAAQEDLNARKAQIIATHLQNYQVA